MAYTTIDDPTAYFQTKLYTGNGGTQSITFDGNTNMQPDWVWVKQRGGTTNHQATDSVRGATKELQPNDTDEERTNTGGVTAFNSNGFSLGSGGDYNGSSNTQVSWNWKAGGSASSNSSGSITSSVSASTDAGFSVVSWTGNGSSGATIGHGLGSVPKMIIVKQRDQTNGWGVYHHILGTGSEMYLNMTQAKTDSNFWLTTPTTSVFSVSGADYVNENNSTYIGYCFAEKKGYSKFGSYTGNGNADGIFVYTGFKPAFVLCKNTGNGGAQWLMVDNKRVGINPIQHYLQSNSDSAEGSDTANFDFLSNGFKCRSTNSWSNQSGYNIIYMAFAENPFVTSTGVPATAR